uniref:ANTH domain-containing protein n=1 Tax=Mesocestoides corti TaxID=53468 RepID=A0A5K3FZZ5_MESCO
FEFCLALLDYQETLLNFQQLVFESVENSSLKTLSTNNCRLVALTQCVQDCAALYDLSLKAMIRLHTMLSPDMLTNHRERFNNLYVALERFFVRANTFPFIRDLLKIPLLPNVCFKVQSFPLFHPDLSTPVRPHVSRATSLPPQLLLTVVFPTLKPSHAVGTQHL